MMQIVVGADKSASDKRRNKHDHSQNENKKSTRESARLKARYTVL
jgi:hypothetical protein